MSAFKMQADLSNKRVGSPHVKWSEDDDELLAEAVAKLG